MTIIRLCRSRYSPKDATGSKLHGGRWNSPGHEVLYASSTLALACLEVLVHIRDVGLIPTDYVYSELEVPEDLITPWTLTGEKALAKIESPVLSREFGDSWFTSTQIKASLEDWNLFLDRWPEFQERRKSLEVKIEAVTPVHAVPSVIIPREMNYLISRAHSQFEQIAWGQPQPFRFDPRLIGTAAE